MSGEDSEEEDEPDLGNDSEAVAHELSRASRRTAVVSDSDGTKNDRHEMEAPVNL